MIYTVFFIACLAGVPSEALAKESGAPLPPGCHQEETYVHAGANPATGFVAGSALVADWLAKNAGYTLRRLTIKAGQDA